MLQSKLKHLPVKGVLMSLYSEHRNILWSPLCTEVPRSHFRLPDFWGHSRWS